MKPRNQEDIDREAASFRLGYFGRFNTLLAYHLNTQKGTFMLTPKEEVQIVSAVLKRGKLLITIDEGGPPIRTFELTFNLVEQLN